MTHREYIGLAFGLYKYAIAYYNGKPEISDEEYDTLYDKLLEYEKENPDHILPISPSKHVGSEPSKNPVNHLFRMYSLDKTHNIDDLSKWCNGRMVKSFVVTPKYDGMSLSITYVDGKLKSLATRGDGFCGEDVTRNYELVDNIPATILLTGKVQVTGEVLVLTETYDAINEILEDKYSNPRIVPTSIMLSKDLKFDKEKVYEKTGKNKLLVFKPYNLQKVGEEVKEGEEFFEKLRNFPSLGFELGQVFLCDEEQAVNSANEIINNRDNYNFQIDGAVIVLNDMASQEALGYTNKFPRFGMALKPKPKGAISKIISVEHQLGTMGTLTPVAIIEPVKIDGVEISRVTLNNYNYIEERDIRIGSKVEVIRSGDVIPKIIGVDNTYVPKCDLIPKVCPSCGAPVEILGKKHLCSNSPLIYVEKYWKENKTKDEIEYIENYSDNECYGTYLKRAEFALTSDGALKTFGINSETISLLVYAGLPPIHLLFCFSKEVFVNKLKRNTNKTDKWIEDKWNALEKARDCRKYQVLTALCIPNVGLSVAKKIAPIIGDLSTLNEEDFDKIEKEVGVAVRKSMEAFWNMNLFRVHLEMLEKHLKIKV